MDYYKRYMGDYARDTSRLSLLEHGAYALLLDDYYSARSPLPAALPDLFRICRATTKPEQAAVTAVANRFFRIAEDGLRHNARADEEIEKWEEMAAANRQKGKLGGRPRGNPEDNQTGSHSDKPEETRELSARVPKSAESETRTQSRGKPSPAPTPDPAPESSTSTRFSHTARAREGPGEQAWRDVGCDAQAYESWLAYRDGRGEPVPPHVRLQHAKWLAGKGPAQVQRELVATCIRLEFKRLHDPAHPTNGAAACEQPQQRTWRPDPADDVPQREDLC